LPDYYSTVTVERWLRKVLLKLAIAKMQPKCITISKSILDDNSIAITLAIMKTYYN